MNTKKILCNGMILAFGLLCFGGPLLPQAEARSKAQFPKPDPNGFLHLGNYGQLTNQEMLQILISEGDVDPKTDCNNFDQKSQCKDGTMDRTENTGNGYEDCFELIFELWSDLFLVECPKGYRDAGVGKLNTWPNASGKGWIGGMYVTKMDVTEESCSATVCVVCLNP